MSKSFIPNIAVLLAGFGGPEKSEEVQTFLQNVVGADPRVRLSGSVSPQRLAQVLKQYEAIGNHSPYRSIVQRQKKALENWFENHGVDVPVFAGFRYSPPFFRNVFLELKKNVIQKILVFVLSPFRSYSSFGKYRDRLVEAMRSAGLTAELCYMKSFFDDKLFVEAQADRVKEILTDAPSLKNEKTFFLFSAHSIPLAESQKSGYADQFVQSASLVARELGLEHWTVAHQSRSGNPSEAWLEPSVDEAIEKLDPASFKNLLLVPLGFVCENAEILYDLDIQAKATAEKKGLAYFRASSVNDHPKFIQMMGEEILSLR